MSNTFYAVQHGDEFSCDLGGSEVYREALAVAEDFHSWYPGEEIRMCVCKTDDDFCQKEIVVYEGTR